MADGYATVAALGHDVVHPGHRHRLRSVPIAGAECQGGRTHYRGFRITRSDGNGHIGRWLSG